jgi:CubicO group peptidase (beta-lactamase class C family)
LKVTPRDADTPVRLAQVAGLMKSGVDDGVFPGAVLLVAREATVLFHAAYGVTNRFAPRPVTRGTFFDLASLTKPLATTLAVVKLVQGGRLSLETSLAKVLTPFQGTPKAGITVGQLLAHTAGYPAYQPYFEALAARPVKSRQRMLRRMLAAEPLTARPGDRILYSDLGFMVLNWVVEAVSGVALDRFLAAEIYGPLGVSDLFFVRHFESCRPGVFAATEDCPWRHAVVEGRVHDDNAYAVGGVEGHAGLFGTAEAVYRLLLEIWRTLRGRGGSGFFEARQLARFLARAPLGERTLGFDTPSPQHASSGKFFSFNSVGHLGFTGTSFWMDLDVGVIVVLLTNRVHPSRQNTAIKAFRPRLHDRVMQKILQNDRN